MKKKLSLFVLVAVLVMAFAGSAFAATATRTWKGDGNGSGNWGDAGNWLENVVPATTDVASFPATTKNVIVAADQVIGAIHVDSGADITLTINSNRNLAIHGNAIATPAVGIPYSIASVTLMPNANIRVQGSGELHLTGGATLAAGSNQIENAAAGAWFDVAEGAVIDVNVRTVVAPATGLAAVPSIVKHGKGVLAFTANQGNAFRVFPAGTPVAAPGLPIYIRDGEIKIDRADHLGNGTLGIARVFYDTESIPTRSATLTTTWSGGGAFSTTDKLVATTNGTLNISVEGSTLTVASAADTGIINANAGTARVITKDGLGTLQLGSTSAWVGAGSTLNMIAGFTVIDADHALNAGAAAVANPDVNVAIGEGTKLTLNKTYWQAVRANTGKGTLELQETSEWDIVANSTFAGKITGAGNLAIGTLDGDNDITVFISGQDNDYSGDTQVYTSAKLQINHEKNLGGTKLGKLYLEAHELPAGAANAVAPGIARNVLNAPFARLEIVDDNSFILPNELFLGVGAARNAGALSNSRPNVGSAVVIVPIDTRLEIANNITFNRNTLVKAGQGEIFLSSIGYTSQGDGSFWTWNAAPGAANVHDVTTALHIINGKARIENERALNLGDIVVDNGGFTAYRPILSIRNGLKMTNSVLFTDQSSFQTELIDANLSEGTNVASAVEVGKVFYYDYFRNEAVTNGPHQATFVGGIVYNRVAFDQLSAGTISKGNDFQLMKATSYTHYDAPKVEPTAWDGQVKAPFDPYFSLSYLYFKATHNIDVPVFGAANVSEVKPGEGYTITIPVTSETGLKAASETLFNLPGATIQISGNSLVITGNAPALLEGQEFANYTYRASVHTMGDVPNSILGYEGYKEYTLKVTPNPGGNTPAGPVISTPTVTKTDDKVSVATTVAVDDVAQAGVEVTFTLTNAAGEVIATEKATTDGHGAASAEFDITELADGDYTITTSADGYAAKTSSFRIGDVPIDPPVDGGSSSGCDAGFGAFALLALGAAVVLRKKD